MQDEGKTYARGTKIEPCIHSNTSTQELQHVPFSRPQQSSPQNEGWMPKGKKSISEALSYPLWKGRPPHLLPCATFPFSQGALALPGAQHHGDESVFSTARRNMTHSPHQDPVTCGIQSKHRQQDFSTNSQQSPASCPPHEMPQLKVFPSLCPLPLPFLILSQRGQLQAEPEPHFPTQAKPRGVCGGLNNILLSFHHMFPVPVGWCC